MLLSDCFEYFAFIRSCNFLVLVVQVPDKSALLTTIYIYIHIYILFTSLERRLVKHGKYIQEEKTLALRHNQQLQQLQQHNNQPKSQLTF